MYEHLNEDKQGRLLRHNLITNAVLRIAQDAGYETTRELNIHDDAGVVLRVDGALYSQYANRPPIMTDISVINPCAPSYIKVGSQKSLAAASLREKAKDKKYTKAVTENHAVFYPLILETYGGFGNKFTRLLKLLQTDAVDHRQLSETESQLWLHNAKSAIAVALQVGNGMISTRSMRFAFIKRRRGHINVPVDNTHASLFVDLIEEQSRTCELAAAA